MTTAADEVRQEQPRGRLSGWLSSWTGIIGLAALVVAVVGAVVLVVIGVRGEPPPATLALQAHQIASTLRCPICEDLSVADSPAPLAGQMRQQITQQLKAGRTADEIRAHFVASYGESVLLSPPHQGIGQIAYVLPIVVVGAGVFVAVLVFGKGRRRTKVSARGRPGNREPVLSAADRGRLDDALARLREEEP
ncbi:MAG TPA: cytochrome c-type biogenesis protein CcmH [Pseudonocardiaceae bacterium]|nr:cytochrome c-type biogenesis protein CcmH [Pseudonocardiaceae bacterium]